MERRTERRATTDLAANVTILGEQPREFRARVVNLTGEGLGLVVGEPVDAGALVKIESGEFLLLGEVCHCRAESEHFVLGLKLEHSLRHSEQLARLAGALEELASSRREGEAVPMRVRRDQDTCNDRTP